MAEANNDLAFMVTGLYGKAVPKQNGAPIRLVLPWKIRLQIGQVDREDDLHRQAPDDVSGRVCSPANTASGPM